LLTSLASVRLTGPTSAGRLPARVTVGGLNCYDITVAFPLSEQGRPPQKKDFGAQYTARLYLCERFALPVARHDASLEAEVAG
jgi:hypothetical protein